MSVLNSVAIVDPNWLLSSTAQSAAAMVAIIGGFLVSRLVSLSSDRNAVLQRLEDLRARQALKAVEYEEAHEARFAVTKRWFIRDNLRNLVDDRGQVDPESLLDSITVGSSEEEMRPLAEHLVATTKSAFEVLEKAYAGSSIPPTTAAALRQEGLLIAVEDEETYESVARSIGERRPKSAFGAMKISPILAATPDIVYQRQDARIAREAERQRELRSLNIEINIAVTRLAAFERPKGVVGAVLALTYLALAGIFLPVVLMTLRPVPDSAESRVVVVIAFASGVIVLLCYFIAHAYSLRPPKPKQRIN